MFTFLQVDKALVMVVVVVVVGTTCEFKSKSDVDDDEAAAKIAEGIIANKLLLLFLRGYSCFIIIKLVVYYILESSKKQIKKGVGCLVNIKHPNNETT